MTARCGACPHPSPFPDGNGDFCPVFGEACAAAAGPCAARFPFEPSARHYPGRMHIRSVTRATPRVDPTLADDDCEEESDCRIPPTRRYTGRVHIRARYRATPKYYPDEVCED
jgi:hypothetical protein